MTDTIFGCIINPQIGVSVAFQVVRFWQRINCPHLIFRRGSSRCHLERDFHLRAIGFVSGDQAGAVKDGDAAVRVAAHLDLCLDEVMADRAWRQL